MEKICKIGKKALLILGLLLCIGNSSCTGFDEIMGPTIVGTWEMETPYSITLLGFINLAENHIFTFQSNGKGVHVIQQIATAMGEREIEEESESFEYVFDKEQKTLTVVVNRERTLYNVEQFSRESMYLSGGSFSRIKFLRK